MEQQQQQQQQQEQQQQQYQTSSLPYPHSPDRTLHISLTSLSTSYLIFLTSTLSSVSSLANTGVEDAVQHDSDTLSQGLLVGGQQGDIRGLSALGSFVYGLPNRFSPTEPLTTPLISVPDTIELATRICRILVLRLGKLDAGPKAVYVGCSITVDGFGDRVREEVDVLGRVVEEVGRLVNQRRQQVNGVSS